MMTFRLCLGIFLALSAPSLWAGSIVSLEDRPEIDGKLTLTPAGIHVDGPSSGDINFADVLEADFSDSPFHLDGFSSLGANANQWPTGWQSQDVGDPSLPGSFSYANGALTLNGNGIEGKKTAQFFFVGRPWTGDGEWTARVSQIDDKTPQTEVGLMLREGMTADGTLVNLGATSKGVGRQFDGPMALFYLSGKARGDATQPPVPIQVPVWLRLTRSGSGLDAFISKDGTVWDLIGQYTLKPWAATWAGFFIDSHVDKTLGRAVLDQLSFTPGPSSAQILPAGVLLRSGSFLAGDFASLRFDPAAPDAPGLFRRNGKPTTIAPSKIAAVVLHPTPRSLIADSSDKVGLVMKNGDFLDGDFQSISPEGVSISSVLLGIATYKAVEIEAGILHPVQIQPANYEVRLLDGSILLANGVSVSAGLLSIEEISGVSVLVSPDEVAQFRAGPAMVQSLFDLPWKATALPPPPSAPAPTPVPPPAPATVTNAPAEANGGMAPNLGPAANPVPDQTPSVACWQGNNQEQIMAVPAETAVDFPLNGSYRALGLRICISPDSPANAQAIVRILADGREIGRTPPFQASDQPRYVQVGFQGAKTVTFVPDSFVPGTRVLLIDPVALRQ